MGAKEIAGKVPWLVVVLVSSIAAVIGLSILVGFVGAPKHERFSWELASVFGTALGTTLLAGATGALAWSTRVDVRATQELAQLTKRDQDERERPLVLLERVGFLFTGTSPPAQEHGRLVFVLRNVGLGPALRVRVTATYRDPRYPPEISSEIIPAIAPGEISAERALRVQWPTLPPTDELQPDGFPLSGDYLDRSRRNRYPIIADWEAERS